MRCFELQPTLFLGNLGRVSLGNPSQLSLAPQLVPPILPEEARGLRAKLPVVPQPVVTAHPARQAGVTPALYPLNRVVSGKMTKSSTVMT